MAEFVHINERGDMELGGRRHYLNCAVYYGRWPHECVSQWFDDSVWAKNRAALEPDFSTMEALGLNSIGLFIRAEDVIAQGQLTSNIERLDEVIATAGRHGVRTIIFPGPFIDNPEIYREMTGQEAPADLACWHPTHSPALFDAYVHVMGLLAERYRREPDVLGYMDRIDRLVYTFSRRGTRPGLDHLWQEWLERRYPTFADFQEAHPDLREKPQSFGEVKLPQDFPDGFSTRDSRAYEYSLMQRTLVGEAQNRFDREIKRLAPEQIMWTPFEGCCLMNPVLDGYLPAPNVLEAIWAEYYPSTGFGEAYRVHLTNADRDYLLLHEFDVPRLPAYTAQAYLISRWLKTTSKCPIILCQGHIMEPERAESPWEYEHRTLIDRTNRAILQSGADGWAYWCWSDDPYSLTASADQAATARHRYRKQGETMGLMRWDGTLRPAAITARDYSRLLENPPALHPRLASEALLLLPEPIMMIEQASLALETATGVTAALLRSGVLPEVRWTATPYQPLGLDELRRYPLVVLGDRYYTRDRRELPATLRDYVRDGGVLLWAVHDTETLEDELGRPQAQPALRELAGCSGPPAKLWPVGEVQWYIHDGFEYVNSPLFGRHRCQLESESFTWLYPDAPGTELIASAKFAEGPETPGTGSFGYPAAGGALEQPSGANAPLFYRIPLGAGWIYIFTWTFNVFRDDRAAMHYGGSGWDWLLRLPLQSAGIVPDLTLELGAPLRDAALDCMTDIRRRY
jgi:hypothetical protein